MSSYVCPLCLHNEPEFLGDHFVSAECGHIFHRECVLGMTRTGITKDLSYNIILIGETGVGKTCLLHRFHDNVYYTPPSTVAVDLFFRTVQIGTSSVQLRIWDTAGQERFRSITPAFVREAHGIIFVYDVTNPKSFEKIPYWADFVSQYGPEHSVRVLVGNKCDAGEDKRKVSVENGVKTGESLNMRFFETSARDAVNVEASFRAVASLILANSQIIPIQRNGGSKGSAEKTKLTSKPYTEIGESQSKKCCS